jgi:hypothetical protein
MLTCLCKLVLGLSFDNISNEDSILHYRTNGADVKSFLNVNTQCMYHAKGDIYDWSC